MQVIQRSTGLSVVGVIIFVSLSMLGEMALADVLDPGIQYCQQNPASSRCAGISESAKAECRSNPASCGITVTQNTDGSIEDGKAICRSNPASCGITVTQNTDGSTEAGKAICRSNPTSCGITVTQNT
ncbi:MAG TPA: hypothetical protein EYP59_10030, partial [Thiotrichaceae bacterium]|nr:hypothetical protein [Thiotrichaceae bacterium]